MKKAQLLVPKADEDCILAIYQKSSETPDIYVKGQCLSALREVEKLAKWHEASDVLISARAHIALIERDIAEKYPAKQGKRTDLELLSPGGKSLSRQQLHKIRTAYRKGKERVRTKEEVKEVIEEIIVKGESPTRENISRALNKKDILARREAVKNRRLSKEERQKLSDVHLYNVSIGELKGKLEGGSVDVILTDPPYQKSDLNLFKELSHFSGKVLKPGGVLLCMSGVLYFPEVLKNLQDCPEIKYHWMLAYIMDGQNKRMPQTKSVQSWKPIIMYVKGKYSGEFFYDRIEYKPPKKTNEYHDWGQALEGITELLNKFAYPGDTVCDPFVGGGSTALAAHVKGCKFIGGDIDKDCIKTTEGLLAEII